MHIPVSRCRRLLDHPATHVPLELRATATLAALARVSEGTCGALPGDAE